MTATGNEGGHEIDSRGRDFLNSADRADGADWWWVMEVRPIEGMRSVGLVGVKRSASDVAPAFGVEAAGRMERDSYESSKEQERGLEEEGADLQVEDEQDEEPRNLDVLA